MRFGTIPRGEHKGMNKTMNKKPLSSLSIFFPCFNDSGTIASLVVLADQIANELTDDYEVIVVDDGSTDASRDILIRLSKDYPALKLILHSKNMGYGGALRSGFLGADKEWVFYTDGDNQYDVRELKRLCEHVCPDIDVINGYKVERSDSLHRIIIGKTYHYIMKIMFGLKIRDVDCDFRLIRKSVFSQFQLKYKSGVVCVELIKKMELLGLNFVNVPVQHYFRMHGKSQFFNFRRLLKVAIDIFRLWGDIFIVSKIRYNKESTPSKTREISSR